MTTTATESRTLPPAGYPFDAWSDDPAWTVPDELRPDYVAAAEKGSGSKHSYDASPLGHTVDETGRQHNMHGHYMRAANGRVSFRGETLEQWAHTERFAAADRAHRQRAAAATRQPIQVPSCDACGETGTAAVGQLKHVRSVNGRRSVRVCPRCAALLTVEIAARVTRPDGRAVRDVVAEIADAFTR